jgi:CRISPR-associated protein Csm5
MTSDSGHCELKTLAYVHIGGGETNLLPMDFAFLDGVVYVANQNLFSIFLSKMGYLDDLLAEVREVGARFALAPFLAKKGLLNKEFLASVASYRCVSRKNPRPYLRPHIRDAYGRPFLPGSSVKGALRTAVMYSVLKDLDAKKRESLLDDLVRNRIADFKKDPRRNLAWFKNRFKKTFSEELEDSVFRQFTLTDSQRKYDPHTDVFRAIRVTDSEPLEKDSLRVVEVRIVVAGSQPKETALFTEVIPPGTTLRFGVVVDQGLLADFGRRTGETRSGINTEMVCQKVSKPLEAAAIMASDLIAAERVFFQNKLNISNAFHFDGAIPNIRVGWGGGLLGLTVDLLLPEVLRQEIRNTFFHERGRAPAPKTRKVSTEGKQVSLGWGRIYRT